MDAPVHAFDERVAEASQRATQCLECGGGECQIDVTALPTAGGQLECAGYAVADSRQPPPRIVCVVNDEEQVRRALEVRVGAQHQPLHVAPLRQQTPMVS